MDVASKPAHSSLAQRIIKVRNCMLVELSTGVSATDKDLFVSLCQTYEQQNVVPSHIPSELRKSLPRSWPISTLSRNIPSRQRSADVLVANRYDGESDFDDWDKGYRL